MGEVVDVVGFVDVGVRDGTVGVCADGGLDVVFCRREDAREGEGGGDVFGSGEQGVVVCFWISGKSVESEVEAGFVAHGRWRFGEGFEGGSGGAREAGTGGGVVVWFGGYKGVFVRVRVYI